MKNLYLATAAAVIGIAAVSAAQATPGIQRGTIAGYDATIIESGSWDAPDFIGVYGPHGPERITVTCAPFSWDSYGANSSEFADSIARAWCF